MPLKVAHVIDALSDNGVSRVVTTLVDAMRSRGDDVVLLACRGIDQKTRQEKGAVEFSTLPIKRPVHP